MRGSLGSGFKNLRLVLVIALMFYSSVVKWLTWSQNLDGYFILFKKLLGKNCGGRGRFAPPFLNKTNIFNIEKICCFCFQKYQIYSESISLLISNNLVSQQRFLFLRWRRHGQLPRSKPFSLVANSFSPSCMCVCMYPLPAYHLRINKINDSPKRFILLYPIFRWINKIKLKYFIVNFSILLQNHLQYKNNKSYLQVKHINISKIF